MIDPTASIHPQACVDAQSVSVGLRTRIWQFASVIRRAWVGADCNIGSCAIVDGAKIGNGCSIGHGVSLNPGIWLGDCVFVGPNATFCNDFWPSTSKDGFNIDALINGRATTLVGEDSSIGAGAVILPGVSIGRGVMIAAGATVDHSVADFHLFRRDGAIVPIDPARQRRRMLKPPALITMSA